MDNRYQLEKSKEEEGVWVYTDKENLVVCKFKQHEFNETQKFSFLEEATLLKNKGAGGLSKIMSEMGDWLGKNHYDIAMPPLPRFELRKIGSQYFCKDNENHIKCVFKQHKFDEHELKIVSNEKRLSLNDLARVLEEMKD